MELAEGTYTVLARADRAPSAAVAERFGGLPVGDRTVAFRSAAQAVRCAVALVQHAATAIGLYAGEIGGGDPHDARAVVLAARPGGAGSRGPGAGLRAGARAGRGGP